MTNPESRASLIDDQRLYSESLIAVFALANLNIDHFIKGGVLCTEVGRGPEIPSIASLNPPLFKATEPVYGYSDNEAINQSLKKMTVCFPEVQILRGDTFEIMTSLSTQGLSFSLITKLYIYPDNLNYDITIGFINHAHKILKPGGAVIMSMDQPDEDAKYGVSFMQAGYDRFRQLLYEVKDIYPERNFVCGGYFLIGIKPKK